jgi:hypothetical protein
VEGKASLTHRIALTAAITILVLGVVPVALAGKGGSHGGGGGGTTTGGGTIALAPLVVDSNGNGLPNWGDVVTFNITTTVSAPYVNLQCFQNGALVANGWNGFFDGALNTTRNFGLSSGVWQSGAADCTAYLAQYTGKGWQNLASTSFHVDA